MNTMLPQRKRRKRNETVEPRSTKRTKSFKKKKAIKTKAKIKSILVKKFSRLPLHIRNAWTLNELRRTIKQVKDKAQKPLLVKDVSKQSVTKPMPDPEDESYFAKIAQPYILKQVPGEFAGDLYDLVLTSRISFNQDFEVIIDNVRYPSSSIIKILQHIVNIEERNEFIPPFGCDEVVQHVSHSGRIQTHLTHYFPPISSKSSSSAGSFDTPDGVRVTVHRGSKVRENLGKVWEKLMY